MRSKAAQCHALRLLRRQGVLGAAGNHRPFLLG
jgi:hypothetical protein